MSDDDLSATYFLDCDAPAVQELARRAIGDATSAPEKASRLYHAVRDGYRYDPYTVSRDPADYRASAIAATKRAFCIPKAVLLAAAARAVGIPARLGFVDVKNHLASEALRQRMGTDLFVWHGYVELTIEGRRVKASPAFDARLCEHFDVPPLDFDGRTDAMLQAFDRSGTRFLSYVREHGTFADLPFAQIAEAFVATYGDEPPPSRTTRTSSSR